MFCHFCGIMGHDLKNCAQHYASRKNGVEKACQYGEWLKATDGQFRSLPKETPTNSKQTNNETVSQGLGGQGAAVVVVGEKQMEAPMERKSHANDDNAKKGSMESEENVPVTDVVIDGAIMGIVKLLSSIINTAVLISNSTQIPTITPTVHVGDMLTKLHAEHVSDNDQVGLQDSKHKPTWKRVIRMDCGPRGDNRDEVLHVLGKRSLQSQEAASDDGVENIEKKKSKTQHDTQISETAGVSEYPCRAQ